MPTLTLRNTKGSELTFTEVDDNFTALNTTVSASVAAAGSSQGTATAITSSIVFITSGTGGVILGTPDTGKTVTVVNHTAAVVQVYPASGHTIDNGAANAAMPLGAGSAVELVGTSSTNWTGVTIDVWDDENNAFTLPIATTVPTTPSADTAKLYMRKIAGRIVPKWMSPSGIDQIVQPQIFGNKITAFYPNTATTGTGINPFGPVWTSNGTVTHPTPSTTAPAISNQMFCTQYANVVTTTNQQLGPRRNLAQDMLFCRGNAANVGGFFFHTRFIVKLWPAATCRIFAGLTGAAATSSVCISDTVVNNTCGLWHDTTDSATKFNFVTRDGTTTTKQAIALSNAIAAGNAYDFYMYCKPNDTVLYWQLEDLNNNVTYTNSTSTTLPVNTVFMQPQVQMSNGTANTTVTTVAVGVVSIYCESDH